MPAIKPADTSLAGLSARERILVTAHDLFYSQGVRATGIDSIIAAGFDRVVVERVTRLIRINEYKRRQAPVGIRVTHRSFGKDWRYPITNKFQS